jgi:gamma-glutamylputrescine oxidase
MSLPPHPGLGAERTWYARNAPEAQLHSVLQGHKATDVCIVGGGLAGLFLAQSLAQRSISSILIEARQIGAGASGRNGGFCSPGWAATHAAIEKKLGVASARELFELSREGFSMVRDTLQAVDAELTWGKLQVSTFDAADALQRSRDHLARRYGYDIEYLDTESVRSRLDSRRYHQGLRDPGAFHCDPLQLCRALMSSLDPSSTELFEATPALGFSRMPAGWQVRTPQGSIQARRLVLCCGGYGGREVGRLRRMFLPITTYIVVTPPLAALGQVIRTTDAVSDDRRAGNYYRIVAGDRLLWGGDITAFGRHAPERIATRMGRDIAGFFPALAGRDGSVAVEIAWSGLMGYARHMMPQVGPLADDLWACTSFGGHGLNTAPVAARLVAEGISGESDRWKRLAPFGFCWNGGLFGPLAAESVYRLMKLADRWRALEFKSA